MSHLQPPVNRRRPGLWHPREEEDGPIGRVGHVDGVHGRGGGRVEGLQVGDEVGDVHQVQGGQEMKDQGVFAVGFFRHGCC